MMVVGEAVARGVEQIGVMHKVSRISDIDEGKSIVADASGQQVAIFKTKGGIIYAIDNVCPHRGGPLGEGHLDGEEVTCPWHAWTFNIKTGECGTAPGVKQKCFPVKIEGGDIFVEA